MSSNELFNFSKWRMFLGQKKWLNWIMWFLYSFTINTSMFALLCVVDKKMSMLSQIQFSFHRSYQEILNWRIHFHLIVQNVTWTICMVKISRGGSGVESFVHSEFTTKIWTELTSLHSTSLSSTRFWIWGMNTTFSFVSLTGPCSYLQRLM